MDYTKIKETTTITSIRLQMGVYIVTVNFMTTKMNIEAEREKMESVVEAAMKIVKNIEPDVKIEKAQ